MSRGHKKEEESPQRRCMPHITVSQSAVYAGSGCLMFYTNIKFYIACGWIYSMWSLGLCCLRVQICFFFFRKMNELMENIVFDKTGETKRNERYIEVITERQWIYLLVHN